MTPTEQVSYSYFLTWCVHSISGFIEIGFTRVIDTHGTGILFVNYHLVCVYYISMCTEIGFTRVMGRLCIPYHCRL